MGVQGSPLEYTDPDWQERFFQHYGASGKIVDAAKAAGVSFVTVYRKLKPGDPQFNQLFYDRFLVTQGPRVSNIEDKFLTQMEEGAHPPTALKFLSSNPLTKNRYEPPGMNVRHSGTVKHKHRHQIERNQMRAEMRKRSQDLFGGPEREVIDVTPDGESGADDGRSESLLGGGSAAEEAVEAQIVEEEDDE